jgi:hypothetical protein
MAAAKKSYGAVLQFRSTLSQKENKVTQTICEILHKEPQSIGRAACAHVREQSFSSLLQLQ